MKKFLVVLLALVMVLSMFACGSKGNAEKTDLEYIKDKGSLIVGITDFEPMDFEEGGKWTGFDAELAKLVGEKLGVKVEFQLIKWEAKETELAGKTIDCIWNGLTWDEDRAKNMSLTDKYMKNYQVAVVRAEDVANYTSAASFDGKQVGAESGSAGEDVIKAALSKATYIEKDAQIDVLTELLGKTIDAGVIDYIMANYLLNKQGSQFTSLAMAKDAIEIEEEYYAVAFRKGSDVTAEVNKLFAEFKKDGTIEKLAKQYGLENALM